MTKTVAYILSPNELAQAAEDFLKRLYPELGQHKLDLTFTINTLGGTIPRQEVSVKTIITEKR